LIFASFLISNCFCQDQVFKPDLSKQENFTTTNRQITLGNSNGEPSVHLDERPGDGVTWINGPSFGQGIIEFDVKGRNVMQQSFVGIAFHKQNDSSYDVVYFRPFNFQSSDSLRKKHCVQYVSLPQFDWFVLRDKFPGKYENSLKTTKDPDGWFHVKVVVAKKISVYLDQDNEPSLVVTPLNRYSTGALGFWVGNGSNGDFANLTISDNH
jgi:hypothetical protein